MDSSPPGSPTTDTADSKASLRRQMRAVRDRIPVAQRLQESRAIGERVLSLPAVVAADTVFCYVSFGSEVGTHGLIRALLAMGKAVAVPRLTAGDQMIAQPIGGLADLVPGRYGFLEPTADSVARHLPCGVTLAPGLAFTRRGDRLGYGGGHYDRYLAAHPGTVAIGVCFEAQVVESLPTEPFDRPMHALVTEAGA